MSSTGVRYQVSGIRCQVITCQVPVSDTGVRYQVSNNNMSIYHAIDVKIVITRYEMIAKHEVTQEMYSPKSPANGKKFQNTINMYALLIHIKYT